MESRAAERLVRRWNSRLVMRWVMGAAVGFLACHAVLRGEVAPFGVALAALTAAGLPGGLWLGALLGAAIFQPWQLVAYPLIFLVARLTRKRWLLTLAACGSLALAAVLRHTFHPWLMYDWLMRLVEVLVCGLTVSLGWNVVALLPGLRRRRVLSQEEWLSLSLAWAVVVLGCGAWSAIGLTPARILAIFAVLCFGQSGGGLGAAMGVLMGTTLALGGQSAYVIGDMGLCGLVCGTFRDWKRPGIVIAFLIANALSTLYINGGSVALLPLADAAAAGVLFLLLGGKIHIESTAPTQAFHLGRLRELWVGRLSGFAATFQQMSRAFIDVAEFRRTPRHHDVARVLETAASQVCAVCPLRRDCWETDFYATYQGLGESLRYIEEQGTLPQEALPTRLRQRCIQLPAFHQQLQISFRLYLHDRRWQENLQGSRRLVGEQLQGVSSVVLNLAREMVTDIHFDNNAERKLQEALDRAGLGVRGVLVQLDAAGHMEVHLERRPCGAMFLGNHNGNMKKRERKAISQHHNGCHATAARHHQTVSLLRELTGHPLALAERKCAGGKGGCVWVYREAASLSVMVGQAAMSGANNWQAVVELEEGALSPVNGDSVVARDIGQGRFILALSDGMGSGERAAQESRAVIQLLENCYEAGLPMETTYKMINSVLILRSPEEIFATVDLCLLDLIGGWADFVKIGAVTSYVLRGYQLQAIRAANLPLGIVEEAQPASVRKRLQQDDLVILVSDGVLDMPAEEQDTAMEALLQGLGHLNPQAMAEEILARSLQGKEGTAERDDMTVMVARVCGE